MAEMYEIRVDTHLSDYHSRGFDGLSVLRQSNGETVLVGPVRDQAALHGFLNQIRDLGVSLLLVKRLTRAEQIETHELLTGQR